MNINIFIINAVFLPRKTRQIMDSICGIPISDFVLDAQGCAEVKILVSKRLNYEKSDGMWHRRLIKIGDLRGYIAGLVVSACGVDGSSDHEVKIKVVLKFNPSFLLLCDKHIESLVDRYILWTNDGVYDDEKLSSLQNDVLDHDTPVKDMLAVTQVLGLPPARMALALDGFVSLFAENLPLNFLKGIETFQHISQSCDTRLVGPPKENEEYVKDPWGSESGDFDSSDDEEPEAVDQKFGDDSDDSVD